MQQVAKVLEFQLQHHSLQRNPRADLLQNGSSCSPRDSQECSSTPQFKGISSSVLSLLYGPTLTSIHDYWKNHQFSSVTQSCLTLCGPMNCSTPGFPVHHQLPEFTQTHVHRGSDATQPSHPLSSPFPPAPSPSQHQGLFQ